MAAPSVAHGLIDGDGLRRNGGQVGKILLFVLLRLLHHEDVGQRGSAEALISSCAVICDHGAHGAQIPLSTGRFNETVASSAPAAFTLTNTSTLPRWTASFTSCLIASSA